MFNNAIVKEIKKRVHKPLYKGFFHSAGITDMTMLRWALIIMHQSTEGHLKERIIGVSAEVIFFNQRLNRLNEVDLSHSSAIKLNKNTKSGITTICHSDTSQFQISLIIIKLNYKFINLLCVINYNVNIRPFEIGSYHNI